MAGFWSEATKQFGPAYEAGAARHERAGLEKTRQRERAEDEAQQERGLKMQERAAARKKQEHAWKAEDRATAENMRYLKEGLSHLEFLVGKGQHEAAATLAINLHSKFPDGREGMIVFKDRMQPEEWEVLNIQDPKANVAVMLSDTGTPMGYPSMNEVVEELKSLITPESYIENKKAAEAELAKIQREAKIIEVDDGTGTGGTKFVRKKSIISPSGNIVETGEWEEVKMPGKPVSVEERKLKGFEQALKGAKTISEKERIKQVYGAMEKDVPRSKIRQAMEKYASGKKGQLTEKNRSDLRKEATKIIYDNFFLKNDGVWQEGWEDQKKRDKEADKMVEKWIKWGKGEEKHITKIFVNPKTKERIRITTTESGELVKKERLLPKRGL